MSSFSIALSGLSAANTALDVTSNNIANANTIGFKDSQAEFADVYASSAVNLNTTTGGEGVQVVTAAQQFTQGDSISEASTPLDMEINGNGFFTMNSPSGIVYTRNGQFSEDQNGNVISSTGQFLQVYPPLANGTFNTGALQNLNLETAQSAPQATSTINGILNLPSNDPAIPATTAFNPADPTTYSESTSTTVFDSLGNSFPATLYYTQTATPGTWTVNMTVNGQSAGAAQTLTFSSTGAVISADAMRTRAP